MGCGASRAARAGVVAPGSPGQQQPTPTPRASPAGDPLLRKSDGSEAPLSTPSPSKGGRTAEAVRTPDPLQSDSFSFFSRGKPDQPSTGSVGRYAEGEVEHSQELLSKASNPSQSNEFKNPVSEVATPPPTPPAAKAASKRPKGKKAGTRGGGGGGPEAAAVEEKSAATLVALMQTRASVTAWSAAHRQGWVAHVSAHAEAFVRALVGADGVALLLETASALHGGRQAALQEAARDILVAAAGRCTLAQLKTLVDYGAAQVLVAVLQAPSSPAQWEETVWALERLASDETLRDALLNPAHVPILVAQLSKVNLEDEALQRALAKVFVASLSGQQRARSSKQIKSVVAGLVRLLWSDDPEVLDETCVLLSQLTEGSARWIQALVDAGACKRLVRLVGVQEEKYGLYALKALANVVSGTEEQAQMVIEADGVEVLKEVLSEPYSTEALQECCYALSNITAGNWEQTQVLIELGVMPLLLERLARCDEDRRVRQEAAWAVANAAANGRKKQVRYLVACGSLEALCALLAARLPKVTAADPEAAAVAREAAVDALASILSAGGGNKKDGPGGENCYAMHLASAAAADSAASCGCRRALRLLRRLAVTGPPLGEACPVAKKLQKKAKQVAALVPVTERESAESEGEEEEVEEEEEEEVAEPVAVAMVQQAVDTERLAEVVSSGRAALTERRSSSNVPAAAASERSTSDTPKKQKNNKTKNAAGAKRVSGRRPASVRKSAQGESSNVGGTEVGEAAAAAATAAAAAAEEAAAVARAAEAAAAAARATEEKAAAERERIEAEVRAQVEWEHKQRVEAELRAKLKAENKERERAEQKAAAAAAVERERVEVEVEAKAAAKITEEADQVTAKDGGDAEESEAEARTESNGEAAAREVPETSAVAEVATPAGKSFDLKQSLSKLNSIALDDFLLPSSGFAAPDSTPSPMARPAGEVREDREVVERVEVGEAIAQVEAEAADVAARGEAEAAAVAKAEAKEQERQEKESAEAAASAQAVAREAETAERAAAAAAAARQKAAAEAQLMARPPIEMVEEPPTPTSPALPNWVAPTTAEPLTPEQERLAPLLAKIRAEETETQLKGIKELRALLRADATCTLDVVASGVMGRVEELMQEGKSRSLQLEAARVVIRVAGSSSGGINSMLETDVIRVLVRLAGDSDIAVQIKAQAVLNLANVVGGSPECRTEALVVGALPVVLAIFNENLPSNLVSSVMRAAMSAMYGLIIGDPQPPVSQIKDGLGHLVQILSRSADAQMHADAMWTFSDIVMASKEEISQAAIDVGIIKALERLAKHSSSKVLIPVMKVLRALGRHEGLIPRLLRPEITSSLKSTLSDTKSSTTIIYEAASVIACFTKGSEEAIQRLVDSGVMAAVLHHLKESKHADTLHECTNALCNAAGGGNEELTRYLVDRGAIDVLLQQLKGSDTPLILTSLAALLNILDTGGASCLKDLVAKDVFRMLKEDLCAHTDSVVMKQAEELLARGTEMVMHLNGGDL